MIFNYFQKSVLEKLLRLDIRNDFCKAEKAAIDLFNV